MDLSLLFVVFSHLTVITSGKTLKFVQALWRHGHRAPGSLPYPNDKNTVHKWPRGWSQLTTVGMRQLDELGEFFQQRYRGNFTSQQFNVSEIYLRSSDSDRAIESAQCFWNGFYPASRDEGFEDGLPWRPLPVHTGGAGSPDPLLKPTGYNCKIYDQRRDENAVKYYDNITNTYSELFNFIREKGGFASEMDINDIFRISSVTREVEYGLDVDDWLLRRWPQYGDKSTLEIASELNTADRLHEFNTDELAILRGGYLLSDWVNRLTSVSRGKLKTPSKMMLYSAHDGTVLALLHAMKVPPTDAVPYAGCVILELYEDEGELLVEIVYRASGVVRALTIPGCTHSCPLTIFKSLLAERMVESKYHLDNLCGAQLQSSCNEASTAVGLSNSASDR